MSAARMRAANKADRDSERWAEQQAQRNEQTERLRPVWRDAFDSQEPENQGPDDYAQWVMDGRPGEDAIDVTYVRCDEYLGTKHGWVFKTGGSGLGYYKDGGPEAMHAPKGSLFDLAPVVLKLDGLIPIKDRIGDLNTATMQDDKVKEQKKNARKDKASKSRARRFKEGQAISLSKTVKGEDDSHRELGLWAIDTANPNAWNGATEYFSSSAADFMAVQETRVEASMVADAENTARNLGWSASVAACVQGVGGGNSAGVGVACRKHIGMGISCEERCLPMELKGRFPVRHIGAMCKGGFHLASGYLHSALGIKHGNSDASVVQS